MPHTGQDLTLRDPIAAEPIRDNLARFVLEARQQTLEEAFGGRGIAPLLHQDVEHDTVLIHGAPEIEEFAVDLQINLIQVPSVTRPRRTLAEFGCELGAEAEALTANTLEADQHAALGQDQLDIEQAQTERVVEPGGMVNDLGREAIAGVGGGLGRHPTSLVSPAHSGQRSTT